MDDSLGALVGLMVDTSLGNTDGRSLGNFVGVLVGDANGSFVVVTVVTGEPLGISVG